MRDVVVVVVVVVVAFGPPTQALFSYSTTAAAAAAAAAAETGVVPRKDYFYLRDKLNTSKRSDSKRKGEKGFVFVIARRSAEHQIRGPDSGRWSSKRRYESRISVTGDLLVPGSEGVRRNF